MLSATFKSTPAGKSELGGYTSTSLAVKSVSGALDDAQSFTISRPVTSTFLPSGAVSNTSTSLRAESGRSSSHIQKSLRQRCSAAPANIRTPFDEMLPPSVGTGRLGSNR